MFSDPGLDLWVMSSVVLQLAPNWWFGLEPLGLVEGK